jgi:hypothetical protein
MAVVAVLATLVPGVANAAASPAQPAATAPAPTPGPPPPAELVTAVRAWISDPHAFALGPREAPPEVPRLAHALVDLDGDGVDDAIVLLADPRFCGSGGCDMLIFHGRKDGGFARVSHSTITTQPVRVSPETHDGWRSLIVFARHVGDVVLRFDRGRYPGNPSQQPVATRAQVAAAQVVIE